MEENYLHLRKQHNQLKKIIPEIEHLEEEMICIHHDLTPWNIFVTKNNKIWFIDYFDAFLGLKYQDIWKFIFSIELLQFPIYPFFIKRKVITAFLKGYKEQSGINERNLFLVKIIYEMFYLTYFVKHKKSFNNLLRCKYLEKQLNTDLENYINNYQTENLK
jgi:Ser/Thr protein kinase RdoA (MazF antagonist)